jgi:hypothetical protein
VSSSAGSGRLRKYPCATVQPRALSRSQIGPDSTPSATTSSPRLRPRSIVAVRDRPSPFGSYSIDRFGDTSVRAFGLYRIRDRLRYVETIQVP